MKTLKKNSWNMIFWFHSIIYKVIIILILGIFSAEEYEKKGISIDILDNKKIYPVYSVWAPTS